MNFKRFLYIFVLLFSQIATFLLFYEVGLRVFELLGFKLSVNLDFMFSPAGTFIVFGCLSFASSLIAGLLPNRKGIWVELFCFLTFIVLGVSAQVISFTFPYHSATLLLSGFISFFIPYMSLRHKFDYK